MKKEILLTGASGFSGKNISSYLTKKRINLTNLGYKKFNKKKIKLDLTKKIKLKKKFDWIIHTAAHHKIEDFEKNAKLKSKRNILMVKNLIKYSQERKIKNFIFFSTIDINYSKLPVKKYIYIKSKLICENILSNAIKKKLLNNLVILRLPAIVGKKSNENFIKRMLINLKQNKPVDIWNASHKYNNLIHIQDLSRLIFYLVEKEKFMKKKVLIDCLSSKPVKLFTLVNTLKRKLKSRSKINIFKKKTHSKKVIKNHFNNYNFFTVKKVINLLV